MPHKPLGSVSRSFWLCTFKNSIEPFWEIFGTNKDLLPDARLAAIERAMIKLRLVLYIDM